MSILDKVKSFVRQFLMMLKSLWLTHVEMTGSVISHVFPNMPTVYLLIEYEIESLETVFPRPFIRRQFLVLKFHLYASELPLACVSALIAPCLSTCHQYKCCPRITQMTSSAPLAGVVYLQYTESRRVLRYIYLIALSWSVHLIGKIYQQYTDAPRVLIVLY
jgi:hypothetical protein